MKKLMMLGILGIVLVFGMTVIGCDNLFGKEASGSSSSCAKNGGCYYIRATGAYEWCGDTSCSAYMSVDVGQATLGCDCN